MSTSQETIHLVGKFDPATLKRWTDWAELTHRNIKHIALSDVPTLTEDSPLIIMSSDGLNDAQL